MGNENSNNELNELEKQLQEINEWQNNANNPGYFIGTGRVPAGVKNLYKAPYVMIIIGLALFLPIIIGLINNFSLTALITAPLGIVAGLGLIVGGIMRIIKNRTAD